MVFNRRDLEKAYSPNKSKKIGKRPSPGRPIKPSTSGTTMKGCETNIKVIVRVRPPNERECQDNCRIVVKVVDDKMLIFDPKEEENPFFYRGVVQKGRDLLKKQNKELNFMFDRMFDTMCTNADVFDGSTKDMIGNLLEGYNCSVFAYGATGAGKTHTMLGKEEEPGITYRTMAELFNQMEQLKEERDFNLGVTYLEIYNENVQDLLHKTGPLHLRDDGRNGVRITGLKIISIDNAEELLGLLTRGNKNRTQFATDANGESSRSHAVFQVYINMTNKLDGQVKCVKLSMIDLAGSERASATGCKGERFKEGANINKSLLALGNCINSLADGTKHIPYRDSKLTRLLKDSLGGNCQTVMIANISPSSLSYDDTYNTLRYANRAKKIKTNVKKNIVSCQMHVTGYIKAMEEQKKQIATLKEQVEEQKKIIATMEANGGKINSGGGSEEPKKLVEEFIAKLQELWYRRKTLNEKFLGFESADKILCCRMSYKRAADERLRYLSATLAPISEEEQNASGKSRLTKSLEHFKRQRESLRLQMSSVWEELRKVEYEISDLNQRINEKNIGTALAKDKMLLQTELERSRIQQQLEHVKKISSLQQCDLHSCNTTIKDICKTLQNYYYIVRGQGNLTESMEKEFKKLIKNLEGVRNIKWSDATMTKQEEDFYNMTILSVQRLENTLAGEVVSILPFDLEDNVEDVEVLENQNGTMILSEDPVLSEDQEDSPDSEVRMNDTFNLQSTKSKVAKKRILSDQQNKDSSSPAKQAKKISPKSQQKPAPPGKENGRETHRPMMSAKSIAILNKLKSERSKNLLSQPKSLANESAALKNARDKKNLPLQKVAKPKVTPSTRVPW